MQKAHTQTHAHLLIHIPALLRPPPQCLRKITPLILTRRQKAEAVAVAAKDYFNYYTSWLPSLSSTRLGPRRGGG